MLSYSTYLGGSGNDTAYGIAVDAQGYAYIVGGTSSSNFPVANAYQSTCHSGCVRDAFITKLDPTGTTLIYSTFLGGNTFNEARAIALDAQGNVYITGSTQSSDFPTTPGALKTALPIYSDAFVTKLNASGGLVYSTFLGGNTNNDYGYAIAVDTNGNVWVAGAVNATDFPVTAGSLPNTATNFQHGFISKLNATGSALLYSSYLGGESQDEANAITVDSAGNAYVGGYAFSKTFPITPGAAAGVPPGNSNAFVMKFTATGTLSYSTFIGGNAERVLALAADSNGNVYATGANSFGGIPTTPGAFQRGSNGSDAFVVKINPTGSQFIYATYLGGTSIDQGNGIAVNSAGEVYVVGDTFNALFPVTSGSLPPSNPLSQDAFVAKLSADGSTLLAATYLAGEQADSAKAVAVDGNNNIYVAGNTFSTGFPTKNPRQTAQTNNGENSDAFVTKFKFEGGKFEFSQSNFSVGENKTAINVTITRSNGNDGLAAVNYQTEDGTASNPTHYNAVSGTLYFGPGDTNKSFTIPIVNDSSTDCGKSFTVKLTNPSNGATLGSQASATVTIINEDAQ